ncbi:MAG: hypothetical protein ABIH55_01590 [Nanoarchaeota archaeon]|nr:hypothetical protein [Nanoarchaeota archaeon]MBU1135571.1 hypothetical protein [Nanoarchaeota archaeon]
MKKMITDKKVKKNIAITQKEHDEWHKKHNGYDKKIDKEHELCHKKMGIKIKDK